MARGHRRKLSPGAPIRTLVVDDSATVRRMVSCALEKDEHVQVVGSAPNGLIAMQKADQLAPDAMILDVEMPEMDGLEVLVRLKRRYPQMVVIMFSSFTERGAGITLQALALGADDYIAKTSDGTGPEEALARLRAELPGRLRQFFELPEPAVPRKVAPLAPAPRAPRPPLLSPREDHASVELVVIGCSTGGPAALAAILPHLPPDLRVPVAVVQHMPPMFTRLMAERLNNQCRLPVFEGREGAPLRPGEIWIAPGDYHMRIAGTTDAPRITLTRTPPENSCRPSVDVLFRSAADTYGERTLAVILTGMGKDGQRGAAALKATGARVIAQDEATSVVWGMPGAVVEEGLADAVLPLEAMAAEIQQQVRGRIAEKH